MDVANSIFVQNMMCMHLFMHEISNALLNKLTFKLEVAVHKSCKSNHVHEAKKNKTIYNILLKAKENK